MTKERNDLLYVCSLIEFLGRTTKNTNSDIVTVLGKTELARQIRLADINHCLSFEEVADELITKYDIQLGTFDSVGTCNYNIPSYIGIGGVYRDLILDVKTDQEELVDVMYQVFTSFISEKISNFNSSLYYENPSYIRESYLSGELLM